MLDAHSRMGLTPEALALEMAEPVRGLRILDLCCGAGGNAIGFARQGCSVLAIDNNPERLEQARHNARVYGVDRRIELRRAEAESCAAIDADLVFINPPWGADWNHVSTTWDSFPRLLDWVASVRAPRTWLKLPPSFVPTAQWAVQPYFGHTSGDRHRVKFLLLTR